MILLYINLFLVYILINNKTEGGYENVFKKINNDFNNYRKINNIKFNWKTFTSDFEKALTIIIIIISLIIKKKI